MPKKWFWLVTRLTRRIWFRATLFSLLAVATALLAIVVAPLIPAGLSAQIGADAVDNILGIIASSMLTVTTFSLSTMVSAYSAATSNVTPRATRLVMEDSTTQNVLATFVGSFLFSLVGIIALTTGAYGDQGRLVLFIVTIGVIMVIVVTLLRWIDHLSRLGRVTEMTQRIEEGTIRALREWRLAQNLGGLRLEGDKHTQHNFPIFSSEIGYVQHVDAAALSSLADDVDMELASLPYRERLSRREHLSHGPVANSKKIKSNASGLALRSIKHDRSIRIRDLALQSYPKSRLVLCPPQSTTLALRSMSSHAPCG